MIGTTVGNYRIVERLGDGGMGSVYRAVDEMLDRNVAIKVLRPELARQAALIERFRQEAIALARLSHPRITALHGLEKHGDNLLMIMEYVRGETLEAIVQRSGRLAWPRAAELCVAVLDALDHAHDKGVVHRDIKPANVMLSHDGVVKVMDFGIARMMGRSRQTQFGHAVGTPTYMAPEQLRGEEVDGRTDLYAVGALLYELVTGRVAFEADSDYALMMLQLNDPPPALLQVVPDATAELDDIVQRAMAKRATDRFTGARDFAQALEHAMLQSPSMAPRSETPRTRLVESPTGDASSGEFADRARGSTSDPAWPALSASDTPATRLGTRPASHETPPDARSTRDTTPVLPFPSTRIAASAQQASGGAWRAFAHDWRTYAMAGALLVASAATVRWWREPPPQGELTHVAASDSVRTRGVQLAASPDSAPVGAEVPPVRGSERAEDLIIAPPPQPAPPPNADGRRSVPVERTRVRPVTPVPPRVPRETVAADDAVIDPRPSPVREDPVRTAAPVSEESESTVLAGVQQALTSAFALLSGRNATAASSLLGGGGLAAQWGALMDEGRISLAGGTPRQLQHTGSRATAEVDASVNVRTPFGANRRHSARFSAQLQRVDGRWQVIRLAPIGTLELK